MTGRFPDELVNQMARLLIGYRDSSGRIKAPQGTLYRGTESFPRLSSTLRSWSGAARSDDRDVAWLAIVKLLAAVPDVYSPARDRQLLLAAKYLLAIDDIGTERVVPSKYHSSRIIPTSDEPPLTIRDVQERGGSFTDTLATRKAVAARILGVKSPSNFKPTTAITQEVARQLLSALADALSPGAFAESEYPQSTDELLGLPAWLRRTVLDLVNALDSVPRDYPQSFSSRKLASRLSLTQVVQDRDSSRATSIYLGHGSVDGVPSATAIGSLERGVVLGDPGSGKTTLLRAATAEELMAGTPSLYVRLPDLARRLPDSAGTQSVTEICVDLFLETHLESAPAQGDRTALRAWLSSDGALFALDGLDEVIEQHDRKHVDAAIECLARQGRRILIGSRLSGYERPHGIVDELRVDRLRRDQVEEFLSDWFEGLDLPEARERATSALLSDGIRDLMSIPLVAGIVAVVAENEDVPTRIGPLYRRYLELFLERRWKEDLRRDPIEAKRLLEAAEQVAWKMATLPSNTDRQLDVWSDLVSLDELSDFVAPGEWQSLQALVRDEGLIVPHGTRGRGESMLSRPYRWLHRTIHEHLVAAHLVRLLDREPDRATAILRACVLRPVTWDVVLEHIASMLPHGRAEALTRDLMTVWGAGWSYGEASRVIVAMALALPEQSSLRQQLARQHIAAQRWVRAGELARREVLEALLSDDELSADEVSYAAVVAFPDHYLPEGQRPDLLKLVDRLESLRGWALPQLLQLVATFDEELAVSRALRRMSLPALASLREDEPARPQLIRSLLNGYEESKFPANLAYGQVLAILVTDPLELRELIGEVQSPGARIARGLDEDDPHAQLDPAEIADLIRGGHSEWAAALAGGLHPELVASLPDAHLWAIAAAMLQNLASVLSPEDSRATAGARLDLFPSNEEDWRALHARLERFSRREQRSADDVIALIRSLTQATQRCSLTDLRSLLAAWTRFGDDREVETFDPVNWMLGSPLAHGVTLSSLLYEIVVHIGRRNELMQVWPIIAPEVRRAPSDLDLGWLHQPLEGILAELEHQPEGSGLVFPGLPALAHIVGWAADEGVPLLSALPALADPETVLDLALRVGGSEWMLLPANLIELEKRASANDSLPYWVRRLGLDGLSREEPV